MFESWCSAWQLSVNIEKCHVGLLHLGFNNASVQYEYNNTVISDVSSVCDLGVDVDSSLKYDGHINRIVAKAYSRIGYIVPWFFNGDTAFLHTLYTLGLYHNMHQAFGPHISLNTLILLKTYKDTSQKD